SESADLLDSGISVKSKRGFEKFGHRSHVLATRSDCVRRRTIAAIQLSEKFSMVRIVEATASSRIPSAMQAIRWEETHREKLPSHPPCSLPEARNWPGPYPHNIRTRHI